MFGVLLGNVGEQLLIVFGFISALKVLPWSVIGIVLFVWSTFAVQLVGRGPEFAEMPSAEGEESVANFRSDLPAMMAFFRIMTLDDWLELVAPILEQAP